MTSAVLSCVSHCVTLVGTNTTQKDNTGLIVHIYMYTATCMTTNIPIINFLLEIFNYYFTVFYAQHAEVRLSTLSSDDRVRLP